MKVFRYVLLSFSLLALSACSVNTDSQSSESSSSTIPDVSSEETANNGNGTNGSSSSEESPKKAPLSAFDEINSKMELVKRAIGDTENAEVIESPVVSPTHSSALFSTSGTLKKAAFVNELPDPTYTENLNEGWSYSSLFEDYQTFDYIVNITNFLHNYMSNGSYGSSFEYGKLYESEGYMELTRSLNVAMQSMSLPTPTLSYVFTKTGNNIECFANWDYTCDALRYNPYVAYQIWNMKILTHATFVFNDDKELEKVYVAYLFEGIQFQIASALFDFKNLTYYSFHAFNGSNEAPYNSDYDTAKAICDERYTEIMNGQATSSHLPLCANIRATKINIGSKNITANDIQYIERQTNARFENQRAEAEGIGCTNPTLKASFVTLYDDVYDKVMSNSFILDYDYGESTIIDHIVEDGAKFSFWRSVVIHNYDTKGTIMAFIEYDDLRKYIADLNEAADDELKTTLNGLSSAVEASKDKYIGCQFKNNDDVYTLEVSNGAYEKANSGQMGSYYTAGEYCYALKKNGTLITRFSIDENNHAYANNSLDTENYCNVFLTDEAIELMKNKYLVVWFTDSEHGSGVVAPMLLGDRKSTIAFETNKRIVNVVIGVYSQSVSPLSFDDMVYTYDTYSAPQENLVALIWLHDWGTFARHDFLESTRSNGIEYNNWMGVFDHIVENGYLDAHNTY